MHNKREEKERRELLQIIANYEAAVVQGIAPYLLEQNYLDIIEYYESNGQLNKALIAIDKAQIHYQYSAGVSVRKADVLVQKGQRELALECVQYALTITPGDFDLKLLLIELFIFFKRYEEAISEINLLKQDSAPIDRAEVLLLEANIAEKRRDNLLTFTLLKSALSCNPRNNLILERIWLFTEQHKMYKEVIPLLKNLIDEHPYSSISWHKLGHALAYLGNYPDAIEAYEYAFIVDEDFEDAYFDFAETCFEAKEYKKSLEAYREIAKKFGTDSDLVVRIGECYQNLGMYETARITLEQAARMGPHNDEVFFRIGECYAAQEKWNQACDFFKKAIRMQNDLEEYYTALAEASFVLGDFETTEAAYRKALEIGPDNSQHWLDFAWFLLEMSRPDEALDLLEESNDFLVENELTYSYIACLFAGGRRQEALTRLAEALLENYEPHPCIYDWLPQLRKDAEVKAIIALYRP